MVNKWLKVTAGGLTCVGLALIAIGVALPIVINEEIDTAINDLWMHKDDADSWGETPGKYGMKVVREYFIFNVTNPAEVILGEKPRVVEVGPFPYQEYSRFLYWKYMDENLKDLGQDTPGKYIGYNYKMDLVQLKNNATDIPLTTPVTSINAFFYLAFIGLAKAPFPLYSMEFLHDVLMAFQSDLYYLTVARVLWEVYFSDGNVLTAYLDALGLTGEEQTLLTSDPVYGLTSFQSLKLWVQAQVDQNSTGSWDDGAFDILRNHFWAIDPSHLSSIIAPGSLWWELTDAIREDMVRKYGTCDMRGLALVQWARIAVTGSPPLDVPPLPLPYYQGLNMTSFDFIAEIGTVIAGLGLEVDYLTVADHLLTPQYTYPMTNDNSLLNRDNIGTFFTYYSTENYTSLLSTFGLETYDQVEPLVEYLYQMGNLPITLPDGSTQQDGYSLLLSRLIHKSLVNETVSLRTDSYFGVLTRIVFCTMQKVEMNCSSFLSQANIDPSDIASICNSTTIGWNITDSSSWHGLQLWVTAGLKSPTSSAFKTLKSLSSLSTTQLNNTLYNVPNSMLTFVHDGLAVMNETYNCGGNCTYDQLFYLQWGESGVTMNIPTILQEYGVKPTPTMQDWYPDRYRVPIEWLAVTKFPFLWDASQLLNYDAFLNPTVLKLFLNSYLSRDIAATAEKYHLPSKVVNMLYNYFLMIIPGYGLFATYTATQWLTGVADPFIMFLNNMTVYEGGDPSVSSIQRMATLSDDQKSTPQHIMYTGKDDSSQTRQYYAYYGHHNMDMYWPGYNASAPHANSWLYTDIWNGSKPILGSDGGQFGTRMKKTDEPYVFISSVLRWFQLKFQFSYQYHGLELYRYVMDNQLLKTAAEVPGNYYFYQEPWGLNGYMNISTQFSGPVFVNLPHCFGCDEAGINMIEYYSFPSANGTQVRIFPSQESDQPFADIEPETGAGVRLVLVFASNMGLYKDYFFPDFYEVSPGAPLYHPYYILKRSVNYTDHQVNRIFGSLILAKKLEVVFRVIGLVVGAVLILVAFALLAIGAKQQKMSKPEYTEMMEEERPRSVHSSEAK